MGISRFLRSVRTSQSGNVFFALFGAVALVGVVGATSMQVMKGPVRSMSEVTKRTVAENNMIASSKLALLAATTQADDGDCDADGFVEPIPFENAGASPKPTGGGYLPATIGAAINDPWDTRYGYCVWDHGAVTTGCTGGNYLAGENSNTGYAIAIISAGPDRTFNTTCSAYPSATALNKTPGSDDVVLGYTYAEAEANSGGLWNLQSGNPDTAEINKNLEVKDSGGTTTFALDAQTGIGDFIGLTTGAIAAKGTNPLSITGGLKFDTAPVETGACTAANTDAFAFDTAGDKLIRCNGANWVAAGGSDNLGNHIATQNVRLGSYWLSGDGGDEGIQVNATGAVSTSGALTTGSTLGVGTNATVGGTLGVTGATTLSTVNTSGLGTLNSLSVTNNAGVGGTLNVTGGTTLSALTADATTLDSLAVTNAATVGTTLGVTGATTLSTVNTSGLATLHSLAVTNNASVGGELDLTGGKIVNLLDPTLAQDAASKAYVDARVAAGTGFVEADPQVSTLTATKWCTANAGGTAIECTSNTPAGAADNLGNHTATQDLAMGTYKITGMGDPTAAQDAATKVYVDSQLATPTVFSVHRNGVNQSISNNTATVIDWTTELSGAEGSFNLATDRFQPTVAGWYWVGLQTRYVAIASSDTAIWSAIYKNGTSVVGGQSNEIETNNASDIVTRQTSGIVYLNGSTDYIDARTFQNTGSAQNLHGLAAYVNFSGIRINPGSGGGGGSDNLGNHTATQDLAMGTYKITGMGDPTAAQDAATKAYVDSLMGSDVSFYVSKTANQTVVADTLTALTFNNELMDSNNNFASNRFTPTVAGKYSIYLNAMCNDTTSSGYCAANIHKNGALVTSSFTRGYAPRTQVSAVVSMNGTTDYIDFHVRNYDGTVINSTTYATGFLIGGGGSGGGADNLGDHIATQNVKFFSAAGGAGVGGGMGDDLGNHIATTTLRSDTNNTDDLGTTAIRWKDGWFAGTVTGGTFSGSGASLTSLPAGNLTGTLPAISGVNLTNLNASNLASGTVAAARLPTFGAAAAGIVGASGGGTTNYLRADGTWAAPVAALPGLASTNIWVGNAGGAAAAVAMSGDATLSNTGLLTIGANAVGSSEITDASITASDMAMDSVGTSEIIAGSVTTSEILDGTIAAVDIAAGAVGSSEVTDNSIAAVDLAADSVGASELAANAVASANIVDGTITNADLASGAGMEPGSLCGLAVAGGCGSCGTFTNVVNCNGSNPVTACPTGFTLRTATMSGGATCNGFGGTATHCFKTCSKN